MQITKARNYLINCHVCDIEFNALRPSDKYCSLKCKEYKRARTEVRKKWRKENGYIRYGKKYAQENKEKLLQLNYDWKKRNPEKNAATAFKSKLKTEFNMTIEDYETLMKKQNYSCAICKKHESEFGRRLHLDVDHQTGELRGALCYTCNRNLIGQHREPELFLKAAEYLSGPFTGIIVNERHYKKTRKRKKK